MGSIDTNFISYPSSLELILQSRVRRTITPRPEHQLFQYLTSVVKRKLEKGHVPDLQPASGKNFQSKVAIQPHWSDYCGTCKHLKEVSCYQAVMKRLLQLGLSSEQEMRNRETNIYSKEEDLCHHKEEARRGKSCKRCLQHQGLEVLVWLAKYMFSYLRRKSFRRNCLYPNDSQAYLHFRHLSWLSAE